MVVVGAGVSGLTSAVWLLERGYDVEVRARDFTPDIVSAVAAAVWYPLRGERESRYDRWLPVSFERFCGLAAVHESGVILRDGIELFRDARADEWWRDVLPGFRHARTDELPPGYADGFVARGVPVIEMPVYLRWLHARVEELGGTIVRREVARLDDVGSSVVVNATGLGARELADDDSMVPIRGQVVRVAQFGLERYILDEGHPDGVVYVYPRARDIVCGGTRERGEDPMDPSPETSRAILRRCAELEPRILDVPVVSEAVGLRPGRPRVRLETEERSGRLVVHNYGHAGNGVTLSWGCAADVVDLVAASGAHG
ncbi:MAG: FAD-dependent oxidoreductase [Actinomycetota bacterium]